MGEVCLRQSKFNSNLSLDFRRPVSFMKQIVTLILISLMLSTQGFAQTRTTRRTGNHARTPNATATAAPQSRGETLPIRRVILYSNGVAYFERRGMVTGHAEVDLQFKQSQVDDVLKSMLVLDLGKGQIGAVSYNSSAPPAARLNEIPFSVEAGTESGDTNGGLAGVLRQLQGARVVVSTGSRTATGAILTIEERKAQIDANKPPVVTHTLVIASETGELMSFDLSEVRSIRLVDEGARRDVSQFADASASARRRDAKTIVVTSDGAGTREMIVSYTIAAPIWKTSYRVVLDTTGQPFFQGWAIVDNVSEDDWSNVSLSLVSGTPISFIQPIQQPLYRYRPVVPIPSDLNLNPQVYEPSEGAETGTGSGAANEVVVAGDTALVQTTQSQFSAAPGVIANGNRASTNNYLIDGTDNNGNAAKLRTSLSNAISSGDAGVKTAASGAEVGDLFEYRIEQPVTVMHDRSALIPILQTRMEGERVSVYNEAVRRDRPLSGMRLQNTSALTLDDGALTVLDGDAYAGEALLARFKPGEKRFITFALDLGTLITARSTNDREPVFMVKAVNGVLEIHYYQMEKKIYTITNQTDKPRLLYIEHPLRGDWKLLANEGEPKPADQTASFYRFRVELKPHDKVTLPVTERRALMDSYAISNLTTSDVEMFVSRRYINEQTRAALNKLIEIKARIAAVDARLAAIDTETGEIATDQARLRENINALKNTAEAKQLIARYVAKANEQETRIEQMTKERREAATERARLQAELDAAIRAIVVNSNVEGS